MGSDSLHHPADSSVLEAERRAVNRSDMNDSTEENAVSSDLDGLLYTLWSETDTVFGPINPEMKSASSKSPLLLLLLPFSMETAEGWALLPEEGEITNSKLKDWQHIQTLSVSFYSSAPHVVRDISLCFCCKLYSLPDTRSASRF